MRSFVIICLLILCASQVPAQSLSVFNIDATNFPTMKAKFYAFDANGQQVSPSTSEISVSEDGIPRTVTNITCPPKQAVPRISLAMSLDVSSSMQSSDFGDIPVELGKATMSKLIPLIADGGSEFALQTCNDHAIIIQDFTTKRNKILSEIIPITAEGNNDFVEHLLNPLTGILNVAKMGKYKRVAVLYTDAWWTALSANELQQCIDLCSKNGITFYAIIYSRPESEPNGIKSSLRQIAEASGGMMFDGVNSQQAANDVAAQIQEFIQNGSSPCEITWQSTATCVAGQTNVQFTWSGQTVQLSYTPPGSSVASLQFNPQSLYIHSKPVGIKFDTTVTITANNSGFSVTNIASTNPLYDINPKSFTLAAGKSQTLTVSYTPPDSSYTWTRFDIATDLCPRTYYVSGSYPGHKPTVPTLKMTRPNGGEQLIVGSDTVITWTGIPLTDTVKLDYSTDDGSSWNFITDKATGGRYGWHVPKTVSDSCLARVEEMITPINQGWAKQTTGGGSAWALTIDGKGNTYITGDFTGPTNFESITLTRTGGNNIFIAKYLEDGNVEWAKSASAEHVYGISNDGLGDIYITGTFIDSAEFGGIVLKSSTGRNLFIAKFHSDGSVEWAKKATCSNFYVNAIVTDPIGNSFITGNFSGVAVFDGITLTSTESDIFLAKYRSDGSIDWVKQGAGAQDGSGFAVTLDNNNNIYITGSFYGTVDFDGNNLVSEGQQDIFIAKYRPDGSIDWVKRAGGWGGDDGSRIVTDYDGNIYLIGDFTDSADFDGHILKSYANFITSKFIAKYRQDGTLEWVNRSGGPGAQSITIDNNSDIYLLNSFAWNNFSISKYHPDGKIEWSKQPIIDSGTLYGSSIATDSLGNIYVTGSFSQAVMLDNTTLHNSVGTDVFVWKTFDLLQSDTSDALFSIVMPQALSEDVDMGKVLVASVKDSVISGFIRNGGSYPFRVDSIAIIGADASQFVLVSGIPPFMVSAAGAHHVEFIFHPSSVGVKSAQIEIFTQADTLFQNITGTGIQQTLAFMGNVIDFGQVHVGSLKDTTISVALQNLGNVPISFSSSSELGPDIVQFSLQSGAAPFTLSAGASQSVTLRFAPKYIGRTSGRIGFEYGGNSPAILTVFGQGLGGQVTIFNDSGFAGDHKNIPMILEKVPVSSIQSEATNFSARIAYDRTVLYPSTGSVQRGERFDTVTVSGAIGSDSILMNLPFVALLGEATSSPMNIIDFTWLDGTGQPADYDVETESGIFYMLGICPAGGTRLYNPDGQISMAHINPNPANGIIHIEITTTETGRTQLLLMNLLGQKVATISDGELVPGMHTFDFDSHALTSGSYFLTLTTPTVRRMERVDLQK
ncbi:MAG: SBBP repeat-containing protein [Candidatus Kapaibacterium sp.]